MKNMPVTAFFQLSPLAETDMQLERKKSKAGWNYRFHALPFHDIAHRRVETDLQALWRRNTISIRKVFLLITLQFVIVILWIFLEAMPLPQ